MATQGQGGLFGIEMPTDEEISKMTDEEIAALRKRLRRRLEAIRAIGGLLNESAED